MVKSEDDVVPLYSLNPKIKQLVWSWGDISWNEGEQYYP